MQIAVVSSLTIGPVVDFTLSQQLYRFYHDNLPSAL
ncbi:MAG: hypothetical protein SCAL_001307 [Candidatus Syntrophoarchaeum caldarius]|uniref:Uncharacterized protein n=1 Tax=Candidatus Syntropharchaeum caldarium TaxID=1838285 RepID=A0A1F2P7T9_9EURY|nr:MAG: hypothetical protein SCAL_001307 [Candidatus Syntrophoarchaeum caldarius]